MRNIGREAGDAPLQAVEKSAVMEADIDVHAGKRGGFRGDVDAVGRVVITVERDQQVFDVEGTAQRSGHAARTIQLASQGKLCGWRRRARQCERRDLRGAWR